MPFIHNRKTNKNILEQDYIYIYVLLYIILFSERNLEETKTDL
jgi:hypothetical protein